MMDLFRIEAEERLTVLSQGLVALEEAGASPVRSSRSWARPTR